MSKKRRFLIAAGVIAACFGAALSVVALLPPGPGVSKGNFDQVQEGMKIEEVERLFGGPGLPFHGFVKPGRVLAWQGDDGSLALIEAADEAVLIKMWHPSNETILDKLRRWLRMPK